jgi:hypothetical protein
LTGKKSKLVCGVYFCIQTYSIAFPGSSAFQRQQIRCPDQRFSPEVGFCGQKHTSRQEIFFEDFLGSQMGPHKWPISGENGNFGHFGANKSQMNRAVDKKTLLKGPLGHFWLQKEPNIIPNGFV